MLIRLLRTHLRPYRRLLLVLIGLQAVQAIASLYLPFLNADVIDKGVMRGDTAYIWRLGGLMLVVTAVQLAFSIGAVYLAARVAMGFGRDIRDALFHRVTGFSAREMNRLGAASLITRITNDVQQVQLLVVMACTFALAAPVTAVGGVILAVRQDGGLAWLLAVALPVLVLSLWAVVSRMIPQFRVMQEKIDGINRVLREQITGIRVVRAFVREQEEVVRFERANDELTDTGLRSGRLMAFMFPIVLLIINGSSVAVIWFGGNRIAAGHLTIGALIAFLSYFVLILMSVMMATFVASMAPRAAVCADRIAEVLNTDSSVWAPAAPVEGLETLGSVEFSGVTFRYPGAEAPVVSDVSFTTPAGTTTAIIGSTGAGKTTLVNLAARLYDVDEGGVRLGGADVRTIAPEQLWSRIGLIPQKPYLFSGTVRSNLLYGKPDATDEELWAALQVAQAADFVAAMAGGLDAVIEQGGANVSGGQRQRLSIARALVRRPDVYLFDDSFSALDVATDARLRAALTPHTRKAAVIVVAQRVSTIRHADQIVVLENGSVVGIGTHDELMAGCPTYREIVESQRQEEAA
ncbi:MAG TPA: ABC transporter ATP-binding protein [Acidimicrobiia bacterium]|nr:ABC transporter ATP-binding protein [Acidimicrobiia bacterium]HZQ79602.1 ABC transporter ATP-binding protein [Acidimicrobiia bacterium]